MTAVGSLSTDLGIKFDFIAARTLSGRFPLEPINLLELISSDGIDYDRWRLNRRAFRVFEWHTMMEAQDYDDAMEIADNCEKQIGHLATMACIIRSVPYSFPQVYIQGLVEEPTILKGAPLGPDVSSGSTSGLICRWLLQMTQVHVP